MIELCSKRRMLAAIIVLVCLSIIIVLLENILTPNSARERRFPVTPETAKVTANVSSVTPLRQPCWKYQTFSVTQACRRCSDFETTSKSIPECANNFYIEVINCEHSGKTFRGCDYTEQADVRRFWLFELTSCLASLMWGGAVVARQRHLERSALRRIQRQLASEV